MDSNTAQFFIRDENSHYHYHYVIITTEITNECRGLY
jgi:hypothetical protein